MGFLGLQFENLVVNNRLKLYKLLHIPVDEVQMASPFLQNKTAAQDRCQIDFLIQTRFNTLYLCEVKFSKSPIEHSVVAEVQEKVARLARPKGFTVRPVLIQVNGVTTGVLESEYFSHITDFGELLG